MTFSGFDVVKVPFPFTDKRAKKVRPALVISNESEFNTPAGHSVLAMITSATHTPWPLDVSIKSLKEAGLPVESIVRMKLFTLDHRLIIETLGRLAAGDQTAVSKALQRLVN